MKNLLKSLVLLFAALLPMAAIAYEQLADGVYRDGSVLYITSGVTALGPLQVNPSVVYSFAAPPRLRRKHFHGLWCYPAHALHVLWCLFPCRLLVQLC